MYISQTISLEASYTPKGWHTVISLSVQVILFPQAGCFSIFKEYNDLNFIQLHNRICYIKYLIPVELSQ